MNLLSSNLAGLPLAHDSRRFDTYLPRIPSKLIRIADADIRKCEASKDYSIYMDVWYVPINAQYNQCAVCAAGAVAAQTIGFGPNHIINENAGLFIDVSKSDSECLGAIDFFRQGFVTTALAKLGITNKYVPCVGIPPYITDPEEFHRNFLALADKLEELGL